MSSFLQSFLHGVARAFTVPHTQREELNKQLLANPGALAAVNKAKESLVIGLVHASVGNSADPLEAALAGAALAQQIERMIPTPQAQTQEDATVSIPPFVPGQTAANINTSMSSGPGPAPSPPVPPTP